MKYSVLILTFFVISCGQQDEPVTKSPSELEDFMKSGEYITTDYKLEVVTPEDTVVINLN